MVCCCLQEGECLRCRPGPPRQCQEASFQPAKPPEVSDRRGSLSAGDTTSPATSPQKAPSKLQPSLMLWRAGDIVRGSSGYHSGSPWSTAPYTNATLAIGGRDLHPLPSLSRSQPGTDVLTWKSQAVLSATRTCQENSLCGSALRRIL